MARAPLRPRPRMACAPLRPRHLASRAPRSAARTPRPALRAPHFAPRTPRPRTPRHAHRSVPRAGALRSTPHAPQPTLRAPHSTPRPPLRAPGWRSRPHASRPALHAPALHAPAHRSVPRPALYAPRFAAHASRPAARRAPRARPLAHYRVGVEILEILMNAIDQFLLAGHADSSQHRSGRLAELIFDKIQPRAMGRCEHENEAQRRDLQVALRLLGDVRGVLVQHRRRRATIRSVGGSGSPPAAATFPSASKIVK